MNVFEAKKARRSVRSYTPDPVPDEVLWKLLESARLAPSAKNYQLWRFIVVRTQEARDRIARGGMFARFVDEVPVVIVACGDTSSRFYVHDTCIALEHLVLTATGEGLGSCWIGSFDEEDLRELLGIPERFRVVALVSIGYSTEKRDLGRSFLHLFRSTKRLEEDAFLESFGRPFAIGAGESGGGH
jgi:nitroreductase